MHSLCWCRGWEDEKNWEMRVRWERIHYSASRANRSSVGNHGGMDGCPSVRSRGGKIFDVGFLTCGGWPDFVGAWCCGIGFCGCSRVMHLLLLLLLLLLVIFKDFVGKVYRLWEVAHFVCRNISRGMHLKSCLGTPWCPRYDTICKNIDFSRDHSGYQRRRRFCFGLSASKLT